MEILMDMEKDVFQRSIFADLNNGDFHLKSTGGRWDGSKWVTDTDASPCINAGNPASDYANEPEPNGNRNKFGSFWKYISGFKNR